ncbi:MAG TPA: hypothetical protein VLM11_10885 [Streptosporangiaceae bacterium]|nr:hypothetical protein [Streptosporangiaceae bacterium]
MVVVTAAELAVALRLRRHCRELDQPASPPTEQPPEEPEASA